MLHFSNKFIDIDIGSTVIMVDDISVTRGFR